MAVQLHDKYILGEFELDSDKHLLKHDHEHVHLPELPFRVLLYLVENRARYVSRQELLERFWSGSDAYEETLTKCVSTIRTHLNDPPAQPRYIETRKKVGYRYIGPFSAPAAASRAAAVGHEEPRGIVPEEDEETADLGIIEGDASKLLPARFRFRTSSSSRTALLAVTLLLAVPLLGIWLYRLLASNTIGPVRSIAVLPFKNLSGDQSEEYFSEGLTESLITSLSNVEGLKVISISSTFHFRGLEVDPRSVGKQLGVTAVLEGTVLRDQDLVRVTVRLVSADDGRVLWVSDSKESTLNGIFGLQDEMARNIVAGLSLKLSEEGESRLSKRYTSNVEAYQLYLRGRYHWDKWTAPEIRKGIDYFQQAIHFDPNYALAYAGMADAYCTLAGLGEAPPNEVMPKAREAATRALELDDTLAEAHTSLGLVLDVYDWNYKAAESEFKRAIELNPNSPTAHCLYGQLVPDITGRFDEAFVQIKRALELDPLSMGANKDFGQLLYYTRQYDASIEQWNKTLALDPSFLPAYLWISRAYEAQGRYDQAVAAVFKRDTIQGSPESEIAERRTLYRKTGWQGYWREQLRSTRYQPNAAYIEAFFMAALYNRAGDKQQTLEWLEKAYQDRSPWMPTMKYDPLFDPLRSDPRFNDLLRRVEGAP
jgi:TolB-like protein/DNA-binding winged helix-turn-helix (wHTH) protein